MKLEDLQLLYGPKGEEKPLSGMYLHVIDGRGDACRNIRRMVIEIDAVGAPKVLEIEQIVRDGSGQLVIENGNAKTEVIRRVTREG